MTALHLALKQSEIMTVQSVLRWLMSTILTA